MYIRLSNFGYPLRSVTLGRFVDRATIPGEPVGNDSIDTFSHHLPLLVLERRYSQPAALIQRFAILLPGRSSAPRIRPVRAYGCQVALTSIRGTFGLGGRLLMREGVAHSVKT